MTLGNSASLTADRATQHLFADVLTRGGYDGPHNFKRLSVSKIAQHTPRAMIVDLDNVDTDRLECLRQLRFVLPDCTIAVMSSQLQRRWAARCHLAGATAVFPPMEASKMAAALRTAARNGCYTDPSFTDVSTDG